MGLKKDEKQEAHHPLNNFHKSKINQIEDKVFEIGAARHTTQYTITTQNCRLHAI